MDIPTNEDFARARAAREERDRGLSDVRSAIMERFGDRGLCEFFILYSRATDLFVGYIFFKNAQDQRAAETDGRTAQMQAAVTEELERVGRGTATGLKVEFHLDNDANVQENYDGDYYARLR